MKKLKCIVLILLLMFPPIFSQEAVNEASVDYIEEQADGSSMNWTKKVLRVTGNGFGPERVKSLGRRKILALRAARMDAMRNILETVKGVNVTSKTSVEDMMLESDRVQAQAQGLVKGMRVVKVTYTDDGGCEMIAEVNLDRGGSFLLTALNDSAIEVEDDYPEFDWIALQDELKKTKKELVSTQESLEHTRESLTAARREAKQRMDAFYAKAAKNDDEDTSKEVRITYTGLLIDARSLGLKPVLAPAILNEQEKKLYGVGVIPKTLKGGAIVDYICGAVDRVKKHKKVGPSPLLIKGIKSVNQSDIMISNEDTEKLASIMEHLENQKVAVLI